MSRSTPQSPPSSNPSRRGAKRGWRRLALVAGAMLAALVAAEVGLRLHAAWFFPRTMRLDDRLGWRRVAGVERSYTNEDGSTCTFTTNRYGLRGPAYEHARTPGRQRVLVVGDSFPEGGQVDDADLVTTQLERGLAADAVQVVNAGVGGWGTVQQYLWLRDEGLRFTADLVLAFVYENDLFDNCLSYAPAIGPRPYAVLDAGAVRIVEAFDDAAFLDFCLPFPGRSFLVRHSYVYRSVNDKLYQPLWGAQLHERDQARREAIDADHRHRILVAVIGRMRALAAAAGSRFAVVLVPTREDVATGRAPALERIAAGFAETGVVHLLLLQPLSEARQAGGPALYFERDIHWTVAGHAAVARILTPFVREQLRAK